MREGLACNASKLNVKHPLEDRLKGWEEQQERMKMEGLRRVFGIAEPVRRGMEMRICGAVGGSFGFKYGGRGKGGALEWDGAGG